MVIKRVEWTAEEDARLLELFNKGHRPSTVARLMGRTVASVDSRRRKFGLKGKTEHQKYSVPKDFEEKAKTMNITKMMEYYRKSRTVVARWMKECGLTPVTGTRRKAVPHNLSLTAMTLTRAELCRVYNTDARTIRGWLDELGIKPLSQHDKRAHNIPAITKEVTTNVVIPRREFDTKTKTVAADAAQYLRKHFQNVFRADIQMYEQSSHTWGDVNKAAHRGFNQYFVSGKGVLWLDELIALAEAKGYSIKETI